MGSLVAAISYGQYLSSQTGSLIMPPAWWEMFWADEHGLSLHTMTYPLPADRLQVSRIRVMLS